jgi:hypothetical protein
VSITEWYPGLKDDAQEEALARAWKEIEGEDLARLARNAGASHSGGVISLSTFGRNCVVNPEKKSITIDGQELKPLASLLVLHYLRGANPAVPTGKVISYRQLPGGNTFYNAFKKRVIDEIEIAFHHQPRVLLGIAKYLNATKLDMGDASLKIDVFPKLPVTVIVWKGDEEVEGRANVLFDETASRFLSTEDLAGVGSIVLSQLVKAKEQLKRQVNDRNEI